MDQESQHESRQGRQTDRQRLWESGRDGQGPPSGRRDAKGSHSGLRQRQEGRGQVRRGRKPEGSPEAGEGQGQGQLIPAAAVPGLGGTRQPCPWPMRQRQIKDRLGRRLNCPPEPWAQGLPITIMAAGMNDSHRPGGATLFPRK